jgi:aspyridone synthetase (hybrid polyketide synthase/nonribosomal peptide synthetase)
MYKTGDRAVWRADGTLGFLGRLSDNTVAKIRGLRIDLRDVESAILSQGSHLVSDAVVTMYQQGDDVHLVAHVVPKRQSIGDETHEDDIYTLEPLLEGLMRKLALPRHMQPSRVVALAKLPINANGKVDRPLLTRTPLPPRVGSSQSYDSSTNIMTLKQVELHLLWGRVLGRTDVPRRTDVDFWAMGGSSLHLVKLQAAIRTEMLVNVSIRDMLVHSTLGGMADLISDRTANLPARESIVWDQETKLPDDLRLSLGSPTANLSLSRGCSEVLLTGADSFLGGHILQALLRNSSIRCVHCIAVPSSKTFRAQIDPARVTIYEDTSLHQQNFGLGEEAIASLIEHVDSIIIAGSRGHCLNNYVSLRHTNVASTKLLATWASPRRVPVHFISSSRVTLLARHSHAALPPVSVKEHQPNDDGSEGLTASKWAGEVFLERVAAEAEKGGRGFPITVHRPCAPVGEEAPSEDSLNAILRYSTLMSTVPRLSNLPVSGYFDFAPVEEIAARIADVVTEVEQPPRLRFRHYSGGAKVRPSKFKGYMEKVYGKEFGELELDEWLARALELGLEQMIAIYLRAILESGEDMVFPFMGAPAPESM